MATTISATRIYPVLFVPNSRTGGASEVPMTDTPPPRVSLQHRVGDFDHVLAKGRIPPSGPSHRGHKAPNFTRHLLFKSHWNFS
ncbi:hypothetical protein ACSBR1_015782 [Camellia fascicularis]